jgi:C4-dicarboxylate-specific signal transduction histidine kinase
MKVLLSRRFGQLSLSVRVSILLVLAALLPLLITIISSEQLSRPQLIKQANTAMATDAQTHIQAIENYFSQPIIDVGLLSQNTTLADYLNGNNAATADATNVLATGYQRNVNYLTWSLIDPQGNLRLSYPRAASPHGPYLIPPQMMAQLTTPGKVVVSSAFYDPRGSQLTVDIDEPIFSLTGANHILGYLRVTLNVNFIWNLVLGERGANGTGSYAFVADQNGVIIADSDITQNFTAIAPFTSSELQDITSLQRYGAGVTPVVHSYGTLDDVLEHASQQITVQLTPPGQNASFQVIGQQVPDVPLTYFVLSPTHVVTALADQELLTIALIALAVLVLATLTGFIVGQRITLPVLSSVSRLRTSSQLLQELAAKEQVTVTEQSWVVDSSQTGLSSIYYYVDATQKAAHRMIEAGTQWERRWPNVRPEETREIMRQVVEAARYIERAVTYERDSSQKLSATIDLTKQVTEQLTTSADATTHAAEQMEQVVSQLQQVVGREK